METSGAPSVETHSNFECCRDSRAAACCRVLVPGHRGIAPEEVDDGRSVRPRGSGFVVRKRFMVSYASLLEAWGQAEATANGAPSERCHGSLPHIAMPQPVEATACPTDLAFAEPCVLPRSVTADAHGMVGNAWPSSQSPRPHRVSRLAESRRKVVRFTLPTEDDASGANTEVCLVEEKVKPIPDHEHPTPTLARPVQPVVTLVPQTVKTISYLPRSTAAKVPPKMRLCGPGVNLRRATPSASAVPADQPAAEA